MNQLLKEQKGKLRIFLGAAPGVGKTFSMLRAAKARKVEGVDVVIGVVETHKRAETDAMLEGLESIPRLEIGYRGTQFQEMNLDAILRRKPQLVLVDELAHTNIPGARHYKRYMDVEELLDAGINVYSTLNVQHIESLNDIVSRITGVTVRETVPDSVLRRAHSVELIDLTPEELLQRLKEGKVYFPEQARLAMNRFFTQGNLTALRELALRQVAQSVDDQMTDLMKQNAIAGPWPTTERVMVCISEDGQANTLIRAAKRSADRRQTAWIALYVETYRHAHLSEAKRRNISQALHLAESLGGETMVVTGDDIAAEVLRVAAERNVSMLVVGKSRRTLVSRLLRPSASQDILENGRKFDVLTINDSEPKKPKLPPVVRDDAKTTIGSLWQQIEGPAHLRSLGYIALTTVLAQLLSNYAPPQTLSLLYVIGVMMVAIKHGLSVSLFAAVISCLCLDFFFIEPRYSFVVYHREDILTLLFFMLVSIAVSFIGDYLQKQIKVTRQNAIRVQALYDFNKAIASASIVEDAGNIVARHTAESLNARVVVFLFRQDSLKQLAAWPEGTRLDAVSMAAADWSVRHGKVAGYNSDTLPAAGFYCLPLKANQNLIGLLAVRPNERIITPDQEHFLNNLASQSAVVLERAILSNDVETARVQTEAEKVRSTFLASVTYDLRSPLDAMTDTLRRLKNIVRCMPETIPLLRDADRHMRQLNHFLQNLMDMTAIVKGDLRLLREPASIRSLIEASISKLGEVIQDRDIDIDVDADMPMVDVDMSMIERVLVHVIDNACRFSPADKPIKIVGRREAHYARVSVIDQGDGISEGERERIFDMFYRVTSGAHHTGGSGLGLAISRGFIEAHAGRIEALPGPDGMGTQIIIRLPVV
ncbi:MAG: sensor histidine kinase KdpD [Alphaproteobacteria bacterium]|nr:sensor histidine kinase KdpD [Alphaproteobacteria bacterium]MBV8547961.1 sensor histidine kinase KdpD [Alphaproteobacteria bacterium]